MEAPRDVRPYGPNKDALRRQSRHRCRDRGRRGGVTAARLFGCAGFASSRPQQRGLIVFETDLWAGSALPPPDGAAGDESGGSAEPAR
jgi:hypothetical protein